MMTTIKGNIGFDKLQALRDASPTGGALGQVSTFELETLQAVFGSLKQSQSEEQLRYNLERFQNTYNDLIHKGLSPDSPQGAQQVNQQSDSGPSLEDLEFTAQQNNMTVEQVKRALGY